VARAVDPCALREHPLLEYGATLWVLSRARSFVTTKRIDVENLTAPRDSANAAPETAHKRRQTWLKLASYAGLISFFLSLIAFNLVDVDIWHEMALIRESLRAGHLLRQDVFAYTPTLSPSIHHEWGAGLLAYGLTYWIGSDAILVLKYLIALLIGFLCLRCAMSMGANGAVWAVLCPMAIYLSQLGFLPVIRAQVYSFFFAACCFWVFEQDSRGNRQWLIPWLCLFPVWVNLHGGFVVGLGLLALYAIEQALRRQPFIHLFYVLAGSMIEVFINPFGPAYIRYIMRALTMTRPYIQEWQPVWFFGPLRTTTFLAAVAIGTYSVAKIGIKRAPGLLMLIATAVQATMHFKLMPLFAIAWISHVPAYLQQTPIGQWMTSFTQRRFAFVLSTWLLVISIYLTDAIRWQFWRMRVPQSDSGFAYPVGAVDYLRQQHFVGNVMVPFRQGAYVSWKLFPAVKVSVDSRYEVAFSDEWVRRTFQFYAAEAGWQETLNAYPTDLVLVPLLSPVAQVIQQSGWHMVYVDREFEILARPDVLLPFGNPSAETFTGKFP